MSKVLRLIVLLLVPLFVLVGCKSGNTGTSSTVGAPNDSNSQSIPSDPAQDASDNAPFDASCPTENTTSFAKTKFVAHAGLGFGAFHRYLYKPYRDGKFKSGASGRFWTFSKAGLSALFIKREVRLASEDVKASPMLCKALAAPLANIGNSISAAYDKLKGGDASGLDSVNNSISQVESTSSADGTPIQEDDSANISSRPK